MIDCTCDCQCFDWPRSLLTQQKDANKKKLSENRKFDGLFCVFLSFSCFRQGSVSRCTTDITRRSTVSRFVKLLTLIFSFLLLKVFFSREHQLQY